MPFYEIVYETGRQSVAFYEDDAEAESALKNHHDRAVNGLSGGPIGAPAERVKCVYVYDEHPNEFNPTGTMSADVVKSELSELVDKFSDSNGIVPIDLLAVEVRGLVHPMQEPTEPFGSTYRMQETKQLDTTFLGEAA